MSNNNEEVDESSPFILEDDDDCCKHGREDHTEALCSNEVFRKCEGGCGIGLCHEHISLFSPKNFGTDWRCRKCAEFGIDADAKKDFERLVISIFGGYMIGCFIPIGVLSLIFGFVVVLFPLVNEHPEGRKKSIFLLKMISGIGLLVLGLIQLLCKTINPG